MSGDEGYLNFFLLQSPQYLSSPFFKTTLSFTCAERLLLPSVASRGHLKSNPTALAAGLKIAISAISLKNQVLEAWD